MKPTAVWVVSLCMASPVLAQPAPVDEAVAEPPADVADDTIVVTGRTKPPTRGDVVDQAIELSRVTPNRVGLYETALPRFWAPICAEVIGLRAELAEAIADRIRANAARVGARVAGPRCTPNVIVVFEDDGRTVLADLERRHSRVFSLVAAPERAEILEQPGPVRVWSNLIPRWTGSSAPPAGWPKMKASVRGQLNRSSLPEAREIGTAVIVFDRTTIVGLSLIQVADYATMRGLSHTRAAGGNEAMGTILAMFAPEVSAPDELTPFDVAYLRSLYWELPNQPAVSKLLGIRARARQEERRSAASLPGTPQEGSP